MFDRLLSNHNMKEQLSRAITENKPLQAYMFCGEEGSGKKTAAMSLASLLVGDEGEKAFRGNHPDVIFLRPEEDKRIISVEQVRDMRQDAFITPTEGKRKVYIIDGPLQDEGQNALLTILEQPPSFSVFIILTEKKELMLETVISRCSVYEMEYVDENEGAEYLKTVLEGYSEDELRTFMRASSGNIGYAIRLAQDKSYLENAKVCEKLALAMASGDDFTVASCFVWMSKDEALSFLSVLTVYLRDIAVYNSTKNTNGLVFSDSILKNAQKFAKINIDKLYRCVTECSSARAHIESGINCALITAQLAIHLCGGKQN